MTIIKNILRRIEDFIIPPLCVVCDNALSTADRARDRARDRWLCDACLSALAANHASRDACPRCSQNRRKLECACEFAWDFPFEKIFAVYDYDDVVKSIARHIKYKGKKNLARHVGRIAAAAVPEEVVGGVDIMIPVPLHKSRVRRRGYNQSEALAHGLLEGLGARGINTLPQLRADLLARIRKTGTQTKLDRESRLKNLSGAFAANPQKSGELKNKRVILIDDVLTTGATVEACTEELLRAGCAEVRVLSMGRGGQ